MNVKDCDLKDCRCYTGSLDKMVEKGYYKHYKGNVYEVICEATHTETEEKLIIYSPVVGNLSEVWARPASMFNDIVNGGKKRFERIKYDVR